MRPQQSSSPSTSNPSQSPGQNNFLQQSSLLTGLSPEMQQSLNAITHFPQDQEQDQKIVSPSKRVVAEWISPGEIRIDITVPASALTLGKLLGEGGFGAVYEGLYNGDPVAIKRLKTQDLTDKAVEELRNEAKIMFQLGLESKYIVPLKKICLEAPHYSLVMELMPRGSLYHLLRNNQPLPWEIRFQIAMDAAWGLKDLHGYHILHRDLKSLNILLDDRLRAKLADFGLAKVKHETSSQSSIAKGTVLWMAPELFDDEPKMTAASDVYSFGMVLWELVTRALPYAKAPNQMVAARWIEKGKKEEIPGDCPPELKKIIESCWETLPAKRPTAVQVAERLKPLVTTEEQKQPSTPSTTLSPKEDLRELEMQKLKAEMEQLKLAHEQQLRAAAEKEQRLKAEKQKEIERLKQQHQAELKRSQEKTELKSPSQTIATPSKTAPIPAIPPTSQSRQTLMPTPKLPASAEQLKLQDQLIAACKQGDEKMVTALLIKQPGAKPDMPNAKGEQPLGAAVWGMCPDVVNALLKQAGGVASMTWDECEKHNLKYYKEVFIVPKFNPQTFGEWNTLLQKMDPNPFIRAFHLKKADEEYCNDVSSSWDKWKSYIGSWQSYNTPSGTRGGTWILEETEQGNVGFRTQIKREVEAAKQPIKLAQEDLKYETPIEPPKLMPPVSQIIPQTIIAPPKLKASPEQLALQDQLIAACEQGDAKTVTLLLKQGAKPDVAGTPGRFSLGKQPLGAAVWGMCPDVVNTLLKEAKGIAPMTWQECEQHNKKYYNNEVFIIPKFDPQTYGEWYQLLQKMDPNPFIRAYHLKKADELTRNNDTSSWEAYKGKFTWGWGEDRGAWRIARYPGCVLGETEKGFVNYRSQIKQGIETAKQPTVALHF